MTNNGESIYKIRANFLKMKEHVTRTTWTTNENIIRCFVITFEYNMTILLLLKAVAINTANPSIGYHSIWFYLPSKYIILNRHNYYFMIYTGHYLAYFLQSAYTTLASNISYFQIIHVVDFYDLAVHFCFTFIFIVLLWFEISLNLLTTNM